MKPLFVDVTEVCLLNRKSEELTGVQRTSLELAFELVTAGRATVVVLNPLNGRFRTVAPWAFELAHLYATETAKERLGELPKLRTLGKYTGLKRTLYSVEQAILETIHGLSPNFGSAVGDPMDLSGGALLTAANFETARRVGLRAKALHPSVTVTAVLHDVIPLVGLAGEATGFTRAFQEAYRALGQAGIRFVANSEHTRQDALAQIEAGRLDPSARPEQAVLLAHEFRTASSTAIPEAQAEAPYFLLVGTPAGRKNAKLVLEAYARLIERGLADRLPALLFAGRVGSDPDRLVANLGGAATVAPFVRLVDQPRHGALEMLYRNAEALLFPSLYEGFGLPVGEALWLGTPVLASNATSIPEVGGDLALYFDPKDAETLADLIEAMVSDPGRLAERRAAIATGHDRLRSWRQVADELADVALA
ncbi:glycosyltransferase family 4 protein [Amorphus sp. 3PC139-8]|uniref:glycosyltransferase family 4 protein n=1 Tax=Amorphus sp. 3PC139-8 TaxID=2735676 RepID=UPI00345DC48B